MTEAMVTEMVTATAAAVKKKNTNPDIHYLSSTATFLSYLLDLMLPIQYRPRICFPCCIISLSLLPSSSPASKSLPPPTTIPKEDEEEDKEEEDGGGGGGVPRHSPLSSSFVVISIAPDILPPRQSRVRHRWELHQVITLFSMW